MRATRTCRPGCRRAVAAGDSGSRIARSLRASGCLRPLAGFRGVQGGEVDVLEAGLYRVESGRLLFTQDMHDRASGHETRGDHGVLTLERRQLALGDGLSPDLAVERFERLRWL